MLAQAVSDSAYAQSFYDEAVTNAKAKEEDARVTMNAYAAAIQKKRQATVEDAATTAEEDNTLAELTATHKALVEQYNAATAAQKANREATAADTSALEANNVARAAAAKKLEDFANKKAKFDQKELLRMKETLDTEGMTDAQRLAYYNQMLIGMQRATEAEENEYESVLRKRDDAWTTLLNDQKKQYQKLVEDVEKQEESMLDGLIGKHESFRDALKGIFNTIVDDWRSMIVKMVAQQTVGPLLKMMQSLGLGGALALGTMAPGAAAQLPGGLGGDPQATAASQAYVTAQQQATTATTARTAMEQHAKDVTTSFGGALQPTTPALQSLTAAADAAAAALKTVRSTGGGNGLGSFDIGSVGGQTVLPGDGVPFNLTEISGNSLPDIGTSAAGGELDSLDALLGGGMLPGLTSGAGGGAGMSGIAAALQGLLTGGAMAGTLSFGNGQNDSGIGSLLGGVAGGIFGGPIGSEIGSILGQLVGSLFGSHETKADQPDIYDPSWQQDDANWNGGGNAHFNGQLVLPGAQYNASNGGTSLSDDIEAWVKSVSGNVAGLTQAQQQLYNEIVNQVNGGNPNATGAQYGIASEKNGVVTFGDGSTMSVTQFEQLVSNFQSTVGTGPGSSPVFQMTRAYPNPNVPGMTQVGTYTPTPVTINNPAGGSVGGGSSSGGSGSGSGAGSGGGSGSGSGSGSTGSGGNGGAGAGGGGTANTEGVNLTVNVTGNTIVGAGGAAQLAQAIATQVKRAVNGLSPSTLSYGSPLRNR